MTDENNQIVTGEQIMTPAEINVSIIIPMRNEEKYIGKCLKSILANNYPHEQYEILIADGGSTDRSREIVDGIRSRHPHIRLLHNPRKIVPTGLNLAIRESRGRYILRMDAHTEYPPDYIQNCIAELERTGAANVGGFLVTRPGDDTLMAKTIALLTQTRVGVGNSAYRLGRGDLNVDTVPFGAFRRDVLAQVGLYREDLKRNQDYELNARVRRHGYNVFLSSKIYSFYYNAPTFRKFMRQGFLNGIWNAHCWRTYPETFCWRHAMPLIFVSGLLGAGLLSVLIHSALWLIVLALGAHLMLGLTASATMAAKGEWRCAALAPMLMFSYHAVYGLATLGGLMYPVTRVDATVPAQLSNTATLS